MECFSVLLACFFEQNNNNNDNNNKTRPSRVEQVSRPRHSVRLRSNGHGTIPNNRLTWNHRVVRGKWWSKAS